MIAEDFRPVRVLATESLAGPRVEGARARTGRKAPRSRSGVSLPLNANPPPAQPHHAWRGRGQRFCYLARTPKIDDNLWTTEDLRSVHKRPGATSGLARS